MRWAYGLAAAVGVSGCSAVIDPDRFTTGTTCGHGSVEDARDLDLRVVLAPAVVGSRLEIWVVDGTVDVTTATARIDSFEPGATDVDVRMTCGVSAGRNKRIFAYADVSGDGVFDPATESAWSMPLPDDGRGTLDLTVPPNATPDDAQVEFLRPLPFTLDMRGMNTHNDEPLYVKIYESDTLVTTGFFTLAKVDTDDVPLLPGESLDRVVTIPHALVEGVAYTLDFYADRDRNRAVTKPDDGPMSDHAWRRTFIGSTDAFVFEHDTVFTFFDF